MAKAPSGTEATASRRWRFLALLRRNTLRMASLAAIIGFIAFNFIAYRHASAMLNYSAAEDRTPPLQSLSKWQKLGVLTCGVKVPRPTNSRSPQDLALPFEIVKFTTADGIVLQGWLIQPPNPQGTALLFHGYSASRASLLNQAKVFFDLGFAALLVDFRGSGGSQGNSTTLGFREADDVAAALHYTRERELQRPLVLYGQSMGGAAILRSLAVLNVFPDGIIVESVYDRLIQTVRNRFERMKVRSFPAAELLVFWGGVQMGCSGFELNPADYARSCRVPALVLHGEEDQNAKPEEGRAIFESLEGSKEMVVFPGVGHASLLDADPMRWKAVVGGFLAKVKEGMSEEVVDGRKGKIAN